MRAAPVGFALAAVCAAWVASGGCNSILGGDDFMLARGGALTGGARTTSATGGGLGGSTGGSATNTASTGGAGHPPQCTSNGDCDGGAGCVVAACRKGACVVENADGGHACPLPGGGSGFCDGLGSCGVTGSICADGGSCVSLVCSAVAPGVDGGPCAAAECCAAPSCTDEVKNGNETDTDCGGDETPMCPRCALGEGCKVDGDCAENLLCAGGSFCCPSLCAGLCQTCDPASGACLAMDGGTDPRFANCTCNGSSGCAECHDGKQDFGETGVDCGGPVCPKCAEGMGCGDAGDCASCMCQAGTCVADTCNDGMQDGCESDVDCGGPCGATCGDGQTCKTKADCFSDDCGADGRCVGP
jgi:hypothetical protein